MEKDLGHLVKVSYYNFIDKEITKSSYFSAVSSWLIVNFFQNDIRVIYPQALLQQVDIRPVFFPLYKEGSALFKTTAFRFVDKKQLKALPVVFNIPKLLSSHSSTHVCIQHYHPDLSTSVLILFAKKSFDIYQCLDNIPALRQFVYHALEEAKSAKKLVYSQVCNFQPIAINEQSSLFSLKTERVSAFPLSSLKYQDIIILALLYNDIHNISEIAIEVGLTLRSVEYRLQKLYTAFNVGSKLELALLIHRYPEILQSLFFSLKK
ncbi:hypothetical protein [Facilibium subflavum]|uniref:hypothetical protein n=1 Tax=Facilibium subflavum TaxID=2219058 RepID=UPI000E64AD85|nr:hypothetical protein [Facilibium subflavum]